MRPAPRVAAAVLAGLAVVLIAAAVVLHRLVAGAGEDAAAPWVLPFMFLAVALPAVLGALLVRRPAAGRIGWVLVLGALSVAIGLAGEPYAQLALRVHPGSLPAGDWAALMPWPVLYAWPLAIAFLFPDGHLPSPRWRLPAALAIASFTLAGLSLLLSGPWLEAPYADIRNPFPVQLSQRTAELVFAPAWVGVLTSLFLGAAAIRARYKRATGVQRLQLLWLTWAALLLPLGLATWAVWAIFFGAPGQIAFALLLAMQGAVALAVAIAVTRHGLYAIDRLVNRTLVYATLTAALAMAYAAVALLAGVLTGRGSTWATAIATLAVALAFQPVRRRVQALVDSRFARARYEGLRRVRAFVAALHDGSANPEDIGGVLALALRDPSAELLFVLPEREGYVDRGGRAVTVPAGDGRTRTPVEQRGRVLGVLLHDPALLERPDLMRSVLAAAGLAIEIACLRVEVRLQLAEVRRSRTRIVRAGYEERRRLERDLHDGAQPRLVGLGLVLRKLQRSLPREAQALSPALDSAVDEVSRAIADLRTIAAGVRPPRLDDGLAPALAELARTAPVPVDVDATAQRAPSHIEAAAYFVACEAITNAVKHAAPTRVRVRAERHADRLRLLVSDDGVGGARPGGGTGLVGLGDRVEAQGGTLAIHSLPGAGTRIEAEFPCAS